jgi:hypothetical protein
LGCRLPLLLQLRRLGSQRLRLRRLEPLRDDELEHAQEVADVVGQVRELGARLPRQGGEAHRQRDRRACIWSCVAVGVEQEREQGRVLMHAQCPSKRRDAVQAQGGWSGKFQALRLCALSALELANVDFGLRSKVGHRWLVVLRFYHILGRSWSEEKCAFGALLRPGQQTRCAIVKIGNGGDGHFQVKAAVQCLTSFGGFLPD